MWAGWGGELGEVGTRATRSLDPPRQTLANTGKGSGRDWGGSRTDSSSRRRRQRARLVNLTGNLYDHSLCLTKALVSIIGRPLFVSLSRHTIFLSDERFETPPGRPPLLM